VAGADTKRTSNLSERRAFCGCEDHDTSVMRTQQVWQVIAEALMLSGRRRKSTLASRALRTHIDCNGAAVGH
jgi:hypothetical protein